MDTVISPLFLKTFRKSYELKNFTETARALGMTQSGVSQHVAHLEELLGTRLFERVGRGLSATPIADRLYAFGGQWLNQAEELIQEIREGQQSMSGRLMIGAPGSFGVYLLKHLVAWQVKNPGLILEIEYGPSSVMAEQLRLGRMDLAISSDPLDPQQFTSDEFFREEYVLVSHPDLNVKVDKWEDFCRLPWIDYVGSENIFHRWVQAHFKARNWNLSQLNTRIRINNMESIFVLLQGRVGVTIFPHEPLADLVRRKKLKIHKTTKVVSSPLFLVSRKGHVLSQRTQALRELILKVT